MQRWQNMLLQVLEHKWKTPRGQNKRERRRYLIVLIKCFKALNISPPQAARSSQPCSGLSGMLATPAPFFRWFGRSELSRDVVAGADTIRVSFQLRDSSPGSHEGRSRCEIKLWLEWFEIQAQACWALWSRATWTDWLPELHWHHGVCVTIRAR